MIAAIENSMKIPPKIKIELPMIHQSHFWVYRPKDCKQGPEEIFVHGVHSSNIHNSQKQLTCPQMDEQRTKGGLHEQWKKIVTCYNMNLEDTMLSEINQTHKKTNNVEFHLSEVSKVVKVIETESRVVVPRGWEE